MAFGLSTCSLAVGSALTGATLTGLIGPNVQIGDTFTIIKATGTISGRFAELYSPNTVFIQGSPGDLKDAESLIALMDQSANKAFNDMRVFYLRNALPDELGQVLSNALSANVLSSWFRERAG